MPLPDPSASPLPLFPDLPLAMLETLFEAEETDTEEGNEASFTHVRRLFAEPDAVEKIGDDFEQTLKLDEHFEIAFQGDYVGVGAAQVGGDELPEWLNLVIDTQPVFDAPTLKFTGPAIVQQNHLIFIPHRSGFYILEKYGSQQVRQIGNYSTAHPLPYKYTIDMAVDKQTVFLAIDQSSEGTFLEMVNISHPGHLYLMDSYLSNVPITNIRTMDNLLFLYSFLGDLQIYDTTHVPRLVSLVNYSIPWPDYALPGDMQISADQNTLCVSAGKAILTLDLRPFKQSKSFNKTYPPLSIYSPGPQYSRGMAFTGDNMLILGGFQSLCVLNLTDPSHPAWFWPHPAFFSGWVKPLLFKNMLLISKNVAELALWDMSISYSPKMMGKVSFRNHNDFFYSMVAVQDEVWRISEHGIEQLDFRHSTLEGTPHHRDDIDASVGDQMAVILAAQDASGIWPTSILKFDIDDIMPQSNFLPKEQRLFRGESRILRLNTRQLFSYSSDSVLRLSLAFMNGTDVPPWIQLNWAPTLQPPDPDRSQDTSTMALGKYTAYIISGTDIDVMDIHDPLNPRLVTSLSMDDINTRPLDIALSEDQRTLFVVKGTAGLDRIDVSSVQSPQPSTIPGFRDPDPDVSYQNIQMAGNIACIRASNSSVSFIRFIDTQNPVNFTLQGTYFMGTSAARDILLSNGEDISLPEVTLNVQAIALANKVLYVLSNNYDCYAVVQVVNIQDPAAPRLIPEQSAAFREQLDDFGRVTGLTVNANTLFLTDGMGNLLLLDLNNVTSSAKFSYKTWSQGVTHTSRMAIARQRNGKTLFIADDTSGLTVLDISDHNSIKSLGQYPSAHSPAHDISLHKETAYMTNTRGLRVYDLRTWEMRISPPAGHDVEGNYYLQLNATDKWGGIAAYTFTVHVEGAPRLNYELPPAYAETGQFFEHSIPADAFTDPNDDPIVFTASFDPQPTWKLKFNPRAATFSGTPSIEDENQVIIAIIRASDPLGQYNQACFSITVLPRLQVKHPITPQPWVQIAGHFFNKSINPVSIFTFNPRPLTYSIRMFNNESSPAWLTNYTDDNKVQWIAGTPALLQVQNIPIEYSISLSVSVRDDLGHEASTPLTIIVHPDYPLEARPLPKKSIDTGDSFLYQIPASTFVDRNGDSTLHYNVTKRPGWIKEKDIDINEQRISLRGTPTQWDTNFFYPALTTVIITARDGYNRSVNASFDIEVTGESGEAWLIKKIVLAGASGTLILAFMVAVIDRWRYDLTKKADKEIESGHPFTINLETPRNLTDKVSVQEPLPVDRLHRFFRPRQLLQAAGRRLPGVLQSCHQRVPCYCVPRVPRTSYLLLPYDISPPWIEHDKSDGNNLIRSKGSVPAIQTYKELRVTVRGGLFGFTQEHFFLKIRNNQRRHDCISATPEAIAVLERQDEESPLIDHKSPLYRSVEMDVLPKQRHSVSHNGKVGS